MKKMRLMPFIFFFSLYVGYAAAENDLTRLPLGKAVTLKGKTLTIDLTFVDNLEKKPDRKELHKNFWPFIYLVNAGYERAIGIGIDLLATMHYKNSTSDHGAVGDLARAISGPDDFWYILKTKNMSTRKKVIDYYDRNKSDYIGVEGYEYGKTLVLGNSKNTN